MTLADVMRLPQQTPADWRARIDYDSWTRKTGTTQLFIHWGGSRVPDPVAAGDPDAEAAQLRSYERYHVDTRGWSGLAYDWAVGQSGLLYRVRGLARSAATSGDVDRDGYSNNLEGEALLFIIGAGTRPSAAALATGRRFVDRLGYRQLYGHREARGTTTTCPGVDLMDWVNAIRNRPQGDDDMRRGDDNDDVRELQQRLNVCGASLTVDGQYGPATAAAVDLLMQATNISGDPDRVGIVTYAKLERVVHEIRRHGRTPPLS